MWKIILLSNFFGQQIRLHRAKYFKNIHDIIKKCSVETAQTLNVNQSSLIINYIIRQQMSVYSFPNLDSIKKYEEAWITLMKKKAIKNCNLIIFNSMECVHSTKSINTIVFCLQVIYRIPALKEKSSCHSWTHFFNRLPADVLMTWL